MTGPSHRRFVAGYLVLLSIVAVVIAASLVTGSRKKAPIDVAATYTVSDNGSCLGPRFQIEQSGSFLTLSPAPLASSSSVGGALRLNGDRIVGDVTCADASEASVSARVVGEVQRDKNGFAISGPQLVEGSLGGDTFTARFSPPSPTAVTAKTRSAEETLGRLMLAIAVVILIARIVGAAVARIGQPRVMGEVVAGILLGPTLLGTVAPGFQAILFPADIVSLLRGAADIGLVFYMFLVGLELDPELLRGRVEQSAFISHGSIAVPMALGMIVAVPVYTLVGPSAPFAPYALFMGVAMSITAFPVLARILVERRMLRSPIGTMAIASAAVDDLTAWVLIALSSAVAFAALGKGGSVPLKLVQVVLLIAAFCAAMGLGVRRLLSRVSDAYDEAGQVPAGWIAAIFLGVLLSAFVAVQVGVAGIFGAFVMGLVMPKRAGLTHDVTRRIEDFVTTLLLPLFFVVTGLNTRVGLLNRGTLVLLTLALVAVAIVGKWTGAMGAARYAGIPWRESAALGALMNTRGLTELIVLNLGLGLGVLTPALYTMLVIMALVTTFMTGPTLRLIDPTGRMSMEPEAELRAAREVDVERAVSPERAILVAPQNPANLDALLSLAVPIARSVPEREVILARLIEPTRSSTGVGLEERELTAASEDLAMRRAALIAEGVSARSIAFTSPDAGDDLVRLTSEGNIDLVVLDGRRPLLRPGPPGGVVGKVLKGSESDVLVLVERQGIPAIGPDRPVMVAFGGADHDWAALELAAWIASQRDAPLVMLGSEADLSQGKRDASRLLASASLIVQQLVGVSAEPRLIPPGKRGLYDAASAAGLLVLGLSDRWREEGLGEVRTEIARAMLAPTAFVKRGRRAGVLAPRDDVTRFTWSRSGAPLAPSGGEATPSRPSPPSV